MPVDIIKPSIAATTVQKTLKKEVYSIFCEVAIDEGGVPVLVLEEGASRGVKSVELNDLNGYVFTLDPVAPITQILNASFILLQDNVTASSYATPVLTGVDVENAKVTVSFLVPEGSVYPHLLSPGDYLEGTFVYTTSHVP